MGLGGLAAGGRAGDLPAWSGIVGRERHGGRRGRHEALGSNGTRERVTGIHIGNEHPRIPVDDARRSDTFHYLPIVFIS
jgi:hypothetical protein